MWRNQLCECCGAIMRAASPSCRCGADALRTSRASVCAYPACITDPFSHYVHTAAAYGFVWCWPFPMWSCLSVTTAPFWLWLQHCSSSSSSHVNWFCQSSNDLVSPWLFAKKISWLRVITVNNKPVHLWLRDPLIPLYQACHFKMVVLNWRCSKIFWFLKGI